MPSTHVAYYHNADTGGQEEKINLCRDFKAPGSNLTCAPFLFRFPLVLQLEDCLKSCGRGFENSWNIASFAQCLTSRAAVDQYIFNFLPDRIDGCSFRKSLSILKSRYVLHKSPAGQSGNVGICLVNPKSEPTRSNRFNIRTWHKIDLENPNLHP